MVARSDFVALAVALPVALSRVLAPVALHTLEVFAARLVLCFRLRTVVVSRLGGIFWS